MALLADVGQVQDLLAELRGGLGLPPVVLAELHVGLVERARHHLLLWTLDDFLINKLEEGVRVLAMLARTLFADRAASEGVLRVQPLGPLDSPIEDTGQFLPEPRGPLPIHLG